MYILKKKNKLETNKNKHLEKGMHLREIRQLGYRGIGIHVQRNTVRGGPWIFRGHYRQGIISKHLMKKGDTVWIRPQNQWLAN